MKYLLLVFLIVLTGCKTIPVNQSMPSLPTEFPSSCKELLIIEGNKVLLSKFVETVAANYSIYHECALHYENLYQWYNKQREIFNKAND